MEKMLAEILGEIKLVKTEVIEMKSDIAVKRYTK